MAKTILSVDGFEHVKGPSIIAAVANGLLAFVVGLAVFDLQGPGTFPVLGLLWQAITFASYIALLVFFLLFFRHLLGSSNETNIRTSAMVAAVAIILSTLLDTYFRSRLRSNSEEFLKWLFSVGVVPCLMLSLFLGIIALRSLSLTSAPMRRISGVLMALLGLQAFLRAWSLMAELIHVGFRAEWSWASWWAFLVQPAIFLLESVALALFFLGIWKSDTRAIRNLCSTPVSVRRWIGSRFDSAGNLSKAMLIAQAAGAATVLAGSVTYTAPYNEIWPLLGRVLLLPGSVIAILVRPDRFNRGYGLLDNLAYTALAVVLNLGALRLWKVIRLRRSRSTEEHPS